METLCRPPGEPAHTCCVSLRLPCGDTGGSPSPPHQPCSSGEDAVAARRDEEMRLRRGAAQPCLPVRTQGQGGGEGVWLFGSRRWLLQSIFVALPP
ncbi:hypothetical protein GQ55_4G308600 [Panicum hallii var. hallii]|uniref:Uncharacterized protein n=1 Tax=Panicum hallii var. hallii TaxID=1504633 RepID=A0A2T7E1U6_9POAL|nr:hypothetical protein GQ55_4G308600 [Panicum hallii var. hallii]